MLSPESTHFLPSRADWMRKEGVVVSRVILGIIASTWLEEGSQARFLREPAGIGTFGKDGEHSPFAAVASVLESYADPSITDTLYRVTTATEETLGLYPPRRGGGVLDLQIKRYITLCNLGGAVLEAAHTLLAFPFNVLGHADRVARQQHGQPIAGSVSAMLAHYRSPGFHTLCEQAALTRNGLWGKFSTHIGQSASDPDLTPALAFDFRQTPSGLIFPLASSATLYLRQQLAGQNRAGKSRQPVSTARSSIGCPARFLQPAFHPDDPADAARLKRLAAILQTNPQTIIVPARQSVIADGLDLVASLLERNGRS